MNTEISGVILQWTLLVTLCYPLGRYIAKVYRGERTWLDFMAPVERAIYRFCGIDPAVEMNWKQFLKALLTVNLFWFFWGMLLLVFQGWLPLNPDSNPGQSPDLAFNTCISFMVNCNLQHYSGETGLSYFTQLFVIMLFQFVTAACGMAAMAGMMKALAGKTTKTIGNFWVFLTRSVTRILMPLSLAVGILLVINGTPMSFDGKQTLTTLEGPSRSSRRPHRSHRAHQTAGNQRRRLLRNQLGAPARKPQRLHQHPRMLVDPDPAHGDGLRLRVLHAPTQARAWIFGVMLLAYTAGVVLSVWQETGGSRQIDGMGISQELGSMEGKEIRIGSAASAMWGMTTTVTSNGSVNSMHDSQTPLSGMLQMLNMQINCWFGGVGVGWMNYFAFLIIAVFISGLMVGRTPEFLGRKVEAREMKIATLVVLLHPFLILVGTGISAAVAAANPEIGWLNNPSFHGLSEMLYEYTSSAANNGSGFEGLADNTPFWNISTGIALIMGRYFPIVGQVAIAGLLASKKCIPESAGTLRTDTGTFSLMTFAVIIIVAALSFFPALALGPIADYLTF